MMKCTTEIIERLRKLEGQYTYKEVSKLLDIKYTTLMFWCRKYDIKFPSYVSGNTTVTKEQLQAVSHLTKREATKTLGINGSTLKDLIDRYGVVFKSEHLVDLTKEELKEMVEEKSVQYVADFYHCSYATIRTMCLECDIELNIRRFDPTKEELEKLNISYTTQEIADILGCSKSNVYKLRERHNIPSFRVRSK